MSDTPIKRTTVQGIRDELRQLWASEAMSSEAVIRARTHNLVVYVAAGGSAEETTRQIIERTGDRPGRVIVIDATREQKAGLDAWVTTYCRSVAQHQICGEMITLATSPDRQEELHSTVIGLLAPNLPVYLWWGRMPDPDDHLFAHLAPEAERILVDSDGFEEASAGFARIAELQQRFKVSDLAWARLSPWRQQMARLWDVAELREALEAIHSLDIHHLAASKKVNPGRSLLLLSWLALRLGWAVAGAKFDTKSGLTVDWASEGEGGKSRLVAADGENLLPGDINQVNIKAGQGRRPVTAHITLHPDMSVAETSIHTSGHLAMHSSCRFNQPDDAMALAEELDLGYDPSYGAAVQTASRILQLAGT